MIVLAINCGSSTLKFQVIQATGENAAERRLAQGRVERLGDGAGVELAAPGREPLNEEGPIRDHREAARRAMEWLSSLPLRPDAVGHRVVHGGERFRQPERLNDGVITAIESAAALAPLHNAPSLMAIRAVRDYYGPAVLQVATFDTAFHAGMPDVACRYAIPFELAARHGIRRYGFHGLAHRFMAERAAELMGMPLGRARLVTLQLGNGCSAAAIDRGRSVDTSMGFTPLEGMMMGTRSGDLDPSLVAFLSEREGVSAAEVERWLNTGSGLKGVSGRSADVRDLSEAARNGDERSALALDMFSYRARKYLGAYLAVLGGADGIVFGGGIGENSAQIRSAVCRDMGWCGLAIDEELNSKAAGREMMISRGYSRAAIYVVPVEEERVIARDTLDCLAEGKGGST